MFGKISSGMQYDKKIRNADLKYWPARRSENDTWGDRNYSLHQWPGNHSGV
jgi:hypothetical protein